MGPPPQLVLDASSLNASSLNASSLPILEMDQVSANLSKQDLGHPVGPSLVNQVPPSITCN
jgi:hypothetical protein